MGKVDFFTTGWGKCQCRFLKVHCGNVVKFKNKGIFNQNSWLVADATVTSELSIQLKCEFEVSMEKLCRFCQSENEENHQSLRGWKWMKWKLTCLPEVFSSNSYLLMQRYRRGKHGVWLWGGNENGMSLPGANISYSVLIFPFFIISQRKSLFHYLLIKFSLFHLRKFAKSVEARVSFCKTPLDGNVEPKSSVQLQDRKENRSDI